MGYSAAVDSSDTLEVNLLSCPVVRQSWSMPHDLRICFAGDSFVAGTGDSSALGWVGRVVAEAIASGLAITAYNLGVRGETGPQIARRIAAETAPRFVADADARLIVSFGANDTVERGGRVRASVEQTVQAIRDIREATVVPVLLVGPPAVDNARQNERLRTTDALLSAEALRLDIPFVETFSATAESPLWRRQIRDGDGYHPDAEGYAFLSSIVSAPIIDWLRIEAAAHSG